MPNEGSYEAAKRRSDEVHADLLVHPENYTMLTGDRPTGRLHLGHYFGTLVDRVRLQDMGVRTNVIIADYQVITDRDTTEHIRDNVYNMVIDYLACGLDPAKTMIFTHSAVPELNQLMLPFLSLVTEAEMERNPTVKAEQEASGHALTGLLLTYPVHQGERPRPHGASPHLPGPPGVRHPLLQGQHRSRGPRPAAAHRDHLEDRPSLQRALRPRVPRRHGLAHVHAAAPRPRWSQDEQVLRQRDLHLHDRRPTATPSPSP